ncbi:MAG: hypothetical protein CW346_15235 [Bacillaceae bacterium]|nr:hypothetical protein [Bacillaceae bacterium]
MMSEEQLKRVERVLRDPKVRYNRRSIEAQTEYDLALAVLLADYRRLRQIIADVRRLVETMEPDNPEVRA